MINIRKLLVESYELLEKLKKKDETVSYEIRPIINLISMVIQIKFDLLGQKNYY